MKVMEMKGILHFTSCLIFFLAVSSEMHPSESEQEIPETRPKLSPRQLVDNNDLDTHANVNLIQNLQHIPTDKLKSLLRFIDKNEDGEPANEGDNKQSSQIKDVTMNEEPSNHEGSGSQSEDKSGAKISFHKLTSQDASLKGLRVYHASDESRYLDKDSDVKNEKSTDKTELARTAKEAGARQVQQESETQNEEAEPITNVLIHAFEGGGEDEKKEDHRFESDLRGMSREENIVMHQGQLQSPRKMADREGDFNHQDLFEGAEEKSSSPIEILNADNHTASALHRMNLMRLNPAVHRIEKVLDTNRGEPQGHTRDNSVREEHPNGGVTTLVNSKPLRNGKNNALRYHKMIKEKLPNKIIEEINDAMIQNVRESGDKSASIQDDSKKPSPQIESPGENNSPASNEIEFDASKRGRPQFAFSYDPESPIGPEMWKVLHTDWTCQGRKQSPINIKTDRVTNDTVCKNVVIHVEPEGRPISGILRNNGHAPTLSLSNSATVRLIGGTLPNDYYLKQLHFHFGCESGRGSEHKIDGQAYPLELHLVFWDKKTFESFALAAKSDRGIAVVAVLFQRSFVPPGENKNTPLIQLLQVLRKIPNEGDFVQITEIFDFRLEKLIPNAMKTQEASRFFTYEGSLSTPGCYESVTWIIFDSHPVVTDDQLEMFRKLKSTKVNSEGTMCDNFRPIQKSYGRRIYSNII